MSTESAYEALRELIILKEMKDKRRPAERPGRRIVIGKIQAREEAAWRHAQEAMVDCFRCAVVDYLVSKADWKPDEASAVVWEDSEITAQIAIDEDPMEWAIEAYCTE